MNFYTRYRDSPFGQGANRNCGQLLLIQCWLARVEALLDGRLRDIGVMGPFLWSGIP
jgi:hypothetical protein